MSAARNGPADAAQRAEALDLERSFIVQAPAGSGKTELLTQRFLKLLARVDRPERLLAITFTRKATFEMRARIMRRLQQAAAGQVPTPDDVADHERIAIGFAEEALRQDARHGWKLLRNPGRLRVLTIDSLCAQFLARNPAQGGLGAGLAVREDAEPLYREAVERLFDTLGGPGHKGHDRDDEPWAGARAALTRVLVHLDGDGRALQGLLVDRLKTRDQWVHRIGTAEGTLAEVVEARQCAELQRLEQALGAGQLERAKALAAELGAACEPGSPPAEFAALAADGREGLDAAVERAWRFCGLLLTSTGQLRKPGGMSRSLFKKLPKSMDEPLLALRDVYARWEADPVAAAAVIRMAKAPPLELGGDTLPLHRDIVEVLKQALAQLRVLFAERGECDFHFMTELALESLGDEDAPGDLLLAEDQRLEHILMDEFQDTSNTQFELLRKLVAGWSAEPGRSLFLVGDPMQSIYRFREANVGLFIDVVERGRLGEVDLQYLQLQSNFRSRTEVVEWVNESFARVFPDQDERDSGAVRYARAHAEKGEGGHVKLHALPEATTPADEAEQVVELVRQAQGELDDPVIAVLARARTHLRAIARALQRHGIEAQAVKVDPLAERPVVLDLLALTRALLHPADRAAWLAVLRAPWCGLAVAELHAVADDVRHADLLERIREAGDAAGPDAGSPLQERCHRVAKVMTLAEHRRADASLRDRVETAWLLLGGPLCYGSEAELDSAGTFLDLLDRTEREGHENLLSRLADRMRELYAGSRPSNLQLMTIHQAKGLEFDVVIVPGLHRPPKREDKVLVAVQEFRIDEDRDAALLAPCPPRGRPEASLYGYLQAVEAERGAYELQRLLYVACTRPKHALHLLARCRQRKDGGPAATANTFLELLGTAFEKEMAQQDASEEGAAANDGDFGADREDAEDDGPAGEAYPLLRLVDAPLLPVPEAPVEEPEPVTLPALPAREAVALGGAFHQWMELIHDHPEQGWGAAWFEGNEPALTASLRRAGFAATEAEARLPELRDMLVRAVTAEPGRSLVSPADKPESWAELPLVRRDGARLSRHIIDRLYRTDDGAWTIADYKTGAGGPESRGSWAVQLQRYGELLQRLTGTGPARSQIYLASRGELLDIEVESDREVDAAPEPDGRELT